MKTYKIEETAGWLSIPATVKKVVAHFKDGHTEKYELIEFVTLKPKVKNSIAKIDCYEEGE